jgi:MutS2 family protein
LNKTYTLLEFDKIKNLLAAYTASSLGKGLVEKMEPARDSKRIEALQLETDQVRKLLDRGGHIPLHGLSDVSETILRLERGGILSASELLAVGDLLRGCRRTRDYLLAREADIPLLAAYARSLTPLSDLEELIELSIDGCRVSDQASSALKKVRGRISQVEKTIESKLHSLLLAPEMREMLQDNFVSQREGRYCLPVRSSFRNKIAGAVVSSSGNASTVFIEPAAIAKLTNQLTLLKSQEANEEHQHLAMLSGEATADLPALKLNVETMAALDFILARGRFSRALEGRSVALSRDGVLNLVEARHPLLSRDQAVPLNLELRPPLRTLVITGPNTGGKTVTLKTVGLLVLMHQAGLHIPVAEGSSLPVFAEILADIGDGQSIEQSLSTFSSHMTNIAGIIKEAGSGSLILLDEIGTGTDPLDGAALAASILEELYQLGALTLASTHFSDIKVLADSHPGFLNGAMDSDPETLQPKYKLLLGQGGKSNGLWIAGRLGISEGALSRARSYIQERGGSSLVLRKEYTLKEGAAAQRTAKPETENTPLRVGDRVYIPSRDIFAVVAELPDSRGNVLLFRDQFITLHRRRLQRAIPKEKLYPGDDYNLDMVLLSKDDRRLKKDMGRKLVPGQVRTVKINDRE